jgi:peroxiredoxin Q/BCP
VSVDDPQTLCDFAASVSAPFPMVADPQRNISRSYGVLWPVLHRDRRITFVIDERGLVVGKFDHELKVGKHVHDVLGLLSSLGPIRPANPA